MSCSPVSTSIGAPIPAMRLTAAGSAKTLFPICRVKPRRANRFARDALLNASSRLGAVRRNDWPRTEDTSLRNGLVTPLLGRQNLQFIDSAGLQVLLRDEKTRLIPRHV